MNVLNKVLANLTSKWNTEAQDIRAITIAKGTGKYNLVTVTSTQLYFHSTSYQANMPTSQSIYLDDYTIGELITAINKLGYIANLASEATAQSYDSMKACTLMEVTGIPLSGIPTLTVFTSTLWQLLYPIMRAVEAWGINMDNSIPQMYANVTGGTWVDYWATFFNVQRTNGQSDEAVRKNMFMNLADIKTNNIALAELVSLITKSKVSVIDVSPGIFEIEIGLSYMSSAVDVHTIIDSAKGGGIKYYLNYTGVASTEDYKAEYKTVHGSDFASSADAGVSVAMTLAEPEAFRMVQINASLTLNKDNIGPDGATMQLVPAPVRMKDTATMTLTLNGTVTRTGTV